MCYINKGTFSYPGLLNIFLSTPTVGPMKHGYFILLFLLPALANAQTTLSPGDLVILNVQADNPDQFIFVPLIDLDANTVIYFTDCGVSAAGAFNSPCTEGDLAYTAPANVSAGTIVTYPGPDFGSHSDTRINGAFSLSAGGDQLFAFQDADPGNAIDPGEEPSLIFGVNNASNSLGDCDEADPQQTDAPSVLTGANAYLAVGSGPDCENPHQNTIYDAATHGLSFPTPAAAFTAFTDPDNWLGADELTDADYAAAATAFADDPDGSASLPVELTAFEAFANGTEVVLHWTTASETNNAGFEIQGIAKCDLAHEAWEALGWVDGHGTALEVHTYAFTIGSLDPGTYAFRLKQIDYDGAFDYSPEVEVTLGLAEAFRLTAPYPNPAHTEASLSLMVPRAQAVTVGVYDLLGRRVATLYDGALEAHQASALVLDAAALAHGLYLIRAESEAFVATQRLVVAR